MSWFRHKPQNIPLNHRSLIPKMNLKELNSFKLSDAVTFHDKLNPKLWNGTKLRPEVREQLLVIAQDFLEELGVHDLDVKDITISGSNAAYSYTKHSDLDLHILVDMGNLPVDEVYRELFTAKKTIYNDTHDIKIHTIPVELYVQDSRQPVVSLGEYSVMNDQWIKIPTKRRSDFDQTATKSKYEKLLSLIEIALKSRKYNKVKHIIDTIKRYRQAGLDKGGEFGPENLAYKMLRSQGYITKLFDLRDKLHSEKLSFETMYQNIDEESNHWYDAGLKDAQRDAKLYPDREIKKLNPRTRLKTMQDKQARHPEEVEQYSLGYRSLKQGVAEQAVTETAEELQELTQFSKGMANFLAKSYAQYIKNPQTAKYVQQQISQPITDGAPYRALMPAIGIVSVPGADTYTSPGLELAKKFVNMVVAYFPAPGDADYNGFSEAAPAVYDARPRTVVINKDYLSDPTYLASTIAHEVQHSIDDLKSRKGLSVKTDQQDLELSYYDQGKAFKQKQSAGATNNAQKYQSYLSMPHEVNARFTEVINDIKQRIEKEDIQNIGSAGLSELARSAFNQHYMHEVFPNGAKDPGYKRLLSRVYAWLSKYYNDRIDRNGSFNPQPATPVLEEQGVAEDKENDNSKLDEILYKLCNIVKKEIKEKTGEHAVAACIIDPDNRIVAKTSKDKHSRWIHAEHNAIDTYEKKYGEVPEGSIIVTTLSPCNEYDDRTSDERFGESCTDYINSKGIKKVYCGYMDPTQDNYNREFNVIETSDNDLRRQCKQFADTFLKKNIDEAFDTPLPITWEKGMHGDVDALAKLPDGSNLSIMFNKQDNIKPDDKTWMVEFYRNNSQEVTGEGDAQKVFSTVLVAIQQFITKYKPLKIYFSASKEMDPTINYGPDDVVPNPESRAKLYDRMVLRYAKSWGYKFFRADNGSSVIYQLSRIPKQTAVAEGLKEAAKSNAVTFFRGEPILSPDRLNQLKSSIGKPYPILRKEGSAANIGTYMSPDGKKATSFVQQALAGQGKGGAVTKIEVDPNSFQNGDGGIDEAVIITNIAGLVSDKDPDSKDPLRINDRKQAMLHYLGPGVRKYLNDPLLNNPEFVKRWYNPEFAQKNWNTIKSGKPAVTKPGESQIQEKMMNLLGPLTEKIRRDPEVINYFLTHNPGDWVEYNFRMNSDGSGTKVVDVKYYPPTKQGVGEDYTMQFAAEKTPPVSPYAGVKDNQYRGGISEASGKKISFKVQKGNGKFSTTLTVNNSPAGIYQYDSNTGRSIAEVYPEFKGKGLGKLLVLHAIYTAAKLGLDFQEDESRTAAYDNVLDSLSSNGYIVDDDGYWYVTGDGEQYLKQSLNEASGYIPSEKEKNDPRFKTALTVDVHPDSIKKNAKAFYWNTSRAGIPPTAKANGKI